MKTCLAEQAGFWSSAEGDRTKISNYDGRMTACGRLSNLV